MLIDLSWHMQDFVHVIDSASDACEIAKSAMKMLRKCPQLSGHVNPPQEATHKSPMSMYLCTYGQFYRL